MKAEQHLFQPRQNLSLPRNKKKRRRGAGCAEITLQITGTAAQQGSTGFQWPLVNNASSA